MASAAKDEKYDFDLFTIGGGTGGVRAARFASADYGETSSFVYASQPHNGSIHIHNFSLLLYCCSPAQYPSMAEFVMDYSGYVFPPGFVSSASFDRSFYPLICHCTKTGIANNGSHFSRGMRHRQQCVAAQGVLIISWCNTGARVALCELPFSLVQTDTEGGLGGTCILRGCVPKKFLVYGGEYANEFKECEGYG